MIELSTEGSNVESESLVNIHQVFLITRRREKGRKISFDLTWFHLLPGANRCKGSKAERYE